MNDRNARSSRLRRKDFAKRSAETLEDRQLMTAAPAQVVMLSASTINSMSVTVDYQINNTPLATPLTLGVYRSASSTYSSSAIELGTVTVAPNSVDEAGNPALSVGKHEVTLPLAGGLPINPMHPYVLVTADPDTSAVTAPTDTASFRTTSIGVIVHGGIQPSNWSKNGPPWEQKMAASMRAEGYDLVIAFNWVAESGNPGSAAKQGPRLAHLIDEAASEVDPNSPVDLQMIGHSEGATIVGQALSQLQPPQNLAEGYKVETLLDPHAASNGFKGKQFSVAGGIEGSLASAEITDYQSEANDPPVVIPSDVNLAQVFYQHTPVSAAHGSNGGLYNLWGQVPVITAPGVPVEYANLTGPGISHAGDFGVFDWYQANIVPSLGDGPAFFNPSELTANLTIPTSGPTVFTGTGVPGTTVNVYAQPFGTSNHLPLGTTTVDSAGNWSIPVVKNLPLSSNFYAHAKVPAAYGLTNVYVAPTVEVDLTLGA